jgi:tetratricopeptide (TPR) repeat protein
LSLHRTGVLCDARALYETLLEAVPDDADILGLTGVLALQEGRPDDAERLLRRAIELDAAPRIQLRNLNNLFAALDQSGRLEAATELAAGGVPNWPEGVRPEPSERDMVLSLAGALNRLDRPAAALALVESILPCLDADADALEAAGRLRLLLGDADAAAADLSAAAACDPASGNALLALAAAYHALGRNAEAAAAALRFARARPVLAAPRRAGHNATVVVLNQRPKPGTDPNRSEHKLHYAANYISQVSARLDGEYRFVSVFADLPEDAFDPASVRGDVIFNNLLNSEWMASANHLQDTRRLIDRIGLPVINTPEAVYQSTRQKSAELLRGIPNLRIPRIERYQYDASALDATVFAIEAGFQYPVILRQTHAHESADSLLSETKTAVLVQDRAELRTTIEYQAWAQFYVVEYVDLRQPDGNFRKLRMLLSEDDIVLTGGGFYSDWLVAGWSYKPEALAFYRDNPHCLETMHRYAEDPEGMIGARCYETLDAIRKRIPLDLFGIDFDIDTEGRVVLFEVSAAMIFLARIEPPAGLEIPVLDSDRINGSLRRAVARRLQGDV